MSRKRPKVPPTFADKADRLVAVASEHLDGPGVYYQAVKHDDSCPALETQSLRDCRCEPWFPAPRRVA